MLDLYLQNKYVFTTHSYNPKKIHELVEEKLKLKNFYLIHNGKILHNETALSESPVLHIIPRTLGGKGGFGSMLRAIGAQIEKTTNREACRDLSGRRLRDINEEKRLKNWIDQQVAREQEVIARKEEKIKRLTQKPKHEFKDDNYDRERAELPERSEDAVLQGLSSAGSSKGGVKRNLEQGGPKKKKKALWVDDIDDDDLSSSDDSEIESEKNENTECKLERNKSIDIKENTECKMDNFEAKEVEEDKSNESKIENTEGKMDNFTEKEVKEGNKSNEAKKEHQESKDLENKEDFGNMKKVPVTCNISST